MSFSILFCFLFFIHFMMDGIIARRNGIRIKTLSALWEGKEKCGSRIRIWIATALKCTTQGGATSHAHFPEPRWPFPLARAFPAPTPEVAASSQRICVASKNGANRRWPRLVYSSAESARSGQNLVRFGTDVAHHVCSTNRGLFLVLTSHR